MVWLNDISPWTFAAIGLGWLSVSGICALALGKVLGRASEVDAVGEQAALQAEARLLIRSPETYREDTADFLQPQAQEELADEDVYAGRAASGTRFKPVLVGEEEGAEEEGAEEKAPQRLRRVR